MASFPSLASMLTHPLAALGGELAVITLVVAFTHRASRTRLAALPVVAAISLFVIQTAVGRLRVPWGTLAGGTSFVFLLQYIEVALLTRRSFEDESPGKKTLQEKHDKEHVNGNGYVNSYVQRHDNTEDLKQKCDRKGSMRDDDPWNRLTFSVSTICSLRAIGTPYQAKNVSPFSTADPRYVPSKFNFLIRMTAICVSAYLFLDAASLTAHPELNSINFAPHKIPFLRRLGQIEGEEMIVRVSTILGVYISLYIYLQLVYGSMAIVAVALGMSDVAAWPPVFGSWMDIWSLRQFWGVFWHQALRRPLSNISSFLTFDVLHIPKSTLRSRYLNILLTFVISGLLHLIADLARGIPSQASGAISFFVTQAGGIMFEDAWRWMLDKSTGSRLQWRCVGGYIWVIVFLVWSTPIWQYPSLSQDTGKPEDALLPWSPLRMLGDKS